MTQINKPIDIVNKLLGKQKLLNVKYRRLKYLQVCEVNDAMLIYNLVTRELVFLDEKEVIAFEKIDITNKTVSYLVENWFLVSDNVDDYTIYCQVESIAKMLSDNDKFPPITSYTILPTTDCNARCFYCFELGCNRIDMTEQTAHDVAKYIKKKHGGKNVRICWFGGEPLYNLKSIDIICNDLVEMGVNYTSYCVSNAYLFDKDTVKKAKELWKINYVQVTLDGTEDIYNKCKAYIYKETASPFLIVLNNIENLLNAEIAVGVRLNIDEHNVDNLKELINLLLERFSKYFNFKIYPALLYEETDKRTKYREINSKIWLYKEIDEINTILKENNLNKKVYVERMRKVYPCMANNNYAVMILPDGKLGKCEAYIDSNTFGSIYSDEIDEKAYLMFKKTVDLMPECKSCRFMPNCRFIASCCTANKHCDKVEREIRDKDLNEKMLNSYLKFLENSETLENDEKSFDDGCS